MLRFSFYSLISFLVGGTLVRADFDEYLKRPEAAFSWKIQDKQDVSGGTMTTIHLVSQTWQNIKWEHDLVVYYPKNTKLHSTLFLYNTGGKSNITNALLGMELAKKIGSPVAFLFGVPNQPLFEGKTEDALIAETFVRYLESKDESWPLLFPMAKSLIKAMDALQAFAKEEWKFEIKDFVVGGASKRGWTSWLTGASGDKRVKAISPLVIDTLNMQKQLPYQVKSYGKPSEMIKDYVQRKLAPIPDTVEGKKLWAMVDPWVYRDKLTLPKMIINGANDPYWTLDALNLYWDDLKGDKWVLYVPNAGHGLEQTHENNKRDRDRALGTMCAFAKCQIEDKPMPKMNWKHDEVDGQFRVTVTSDPAPKAARLWVADAESRDFRQAKWQEQAAKVKKETVTGLVAKPKQGHRVFFAECEYEVEGLKYYLSSQLRIVESEK